ncbi:MAG: TlpA family protein disulfide reductase [Alphaproteobacteria bacterium]|nr:TlpA family protein disulfide reductase [Alphaproteobacteria bacterium]
MLRNTLLLLVLIGAGYGITWALQFTTPLPATMPTTQHGNAVSPQPMPEFSFKTPDGRTHRASDFKGKIIILNFWASWCAPCVKEFPQLIKLADAFQKDAVLIALSSDIDLESIDKFLRSQKNIYARANVFVALDEDQKVTRDLFQSYRLPETWIIDKQHNLAGKFVGADWDYDEAVQKLNELQ